jgi:hypothetical protein
MSISNEHPMNLAELILYLESKPPEKKTRGGIRFPHSYYGCHAFIAFLHTPGVTTYGEMLASAKEAFGHIEGSGEYDSACYYVEDFLVRGKPLTPSFFIESEKAL